MTLRRLYIETMQAIVSQTPTTVLDDGIKGRCRCSTSATRPPPRRQPHPGRRHDAQHRIRRSSSSLR